jgi:2,5-dihydroxypyridine 5,6-dioxygenase
VAPLTEWKWIERFAAQLELSDVRPGEVAVLLSESASRPELVETTRLALGKLGTQVAQVVMPTPPSSDPVPVRSTGASTALQQHRAAIAALAAADIVVDCTVEGLLHSPELGAILAGGARVLMISNEHPEIYERMGDDPGLRPRVEQGLARLRAAEVMHVASAAGTDLTVRLAGGFAAGSWGATDGPGTIAHWPGGLVLTFPARGSVNGRVVLAPGDLNLTFKEYVRSEVALTVDDDYVTAIAGDGLDARLLRSYLASFGDPDAYAVSHVGWGMNHAARWDWLPAYDKRDHNGTEARAAAGNFLISTGANETAGRFSRGHFDLPMFGCTVTLDGDPVVVEGVLVPPPDTELTARG